MANVTMQADAEPVSVLVPNPMPGGAGYAIAIALHKAGFRTHVALDEELQGGLTQSRAFTSVTRVRVPRNTLTLGLGPRPNNAEEARYLESLLSICEQHAVRFIVSSIEVDTVFLARNRAALVARGVDPLVPTDEVLLRLCDKYNVVQLANAVGFPTPKTALIARLDDLADAIDEVGGLPVVIKRRVGMGSTFVRLARTMEEAQRCFSVLCTEGFTSIIVQEFIPGEQERSLNYLLKGPEVLCQFALKKPHHLRPSYSISFVVMPEVPELRLGAELLRHARHDGPAVIQTVFDPRDGRHKILEINARFGNNARILIGAGIDLPTWLINAKRGLLNPSAIPKLEGRAGFCPVEMAVLVKRSVLRKQETGSRHPGVAAVAASVLRLLRLRPAFDANAQQILTEPGNALRAIVGGVRVEPLPLSAANPFCKIPWGDLMC